MRLALRGRILRLKKCVNVFRRDFSPLFICESVQIAERVFTQLPRVSSEPPVDEKLSDEFGVGHTPKPPL
jgi:hypothetical protein